MPPLGISCPTPESHGDAGPRREKVAGSGLSFSPEKTIFAGQFLFRQLTGTVLQLQGSRGQTAVPRRQTFVQLKWLYSNGPCEIGIELCLSCSGCPQNISSNCYIVYLSFLSRSSLRAPLYLADDRSDRSTATVVYTIIFLGGIIATVQVLCCIVWVLEAQLSRIVALLHVSAPSCFFSLLLLVACFLFLPAPCPC